MLPRTAVRYLKLPVLGDILDGLAHWFAAQGFQPARICIRTRKAPVLEAMLADPGVRVLDELSRERLPSLTPRPARSQRDLSAPERSMVAYLRDSNLLLLEDPSPGALLVDAYREFLRKVRGLAAETLRHHRHTALLLLEFPGFDQHPSALRKLTSQRVEALVFQTAADHGRSSLQQRVSQLRSFLGFLARRGMVRSGLAAGIQTPPTHREERLPRAQPWETVQAFLTEFDRGSAIGKRHFCMFLLMATYGLRSSEVAALDLNSIRCRAGCMQAFQPKALAPLALRLTDEVGAALVDYSHDGRPRSHHCRVFLSSRMPAVPLQSPGERAAFRRHALRSETGIAAEAHCMRHCLANRPVRARAPRPSPGRGAEAAAAVRGGLPMRTPARHSLLSPVIASYLDQQSRWASGTATKRAFWRHSTGSYPSTATPP
ncbi:MAG: tyrosine-type recombinase/integrase [Bryobacterales bacterium]|nr:tyrosine-type recombinase/integrase [Bryobacterales bacterium]